MKLAIFNDNRKADTDRFARRFADEQVLSRLRALHTRVQAEGIANLSGADDLLVSIGMETAADGRVTRNCYGVFGLAWEVAAHPEWAGQIAQEVAEVRARIHAVHRVPLRFLIWAGMGGSIEDKAMYNAAGLLRDGPMFYPLDSTDPAKLKAILHDLERRSRRTLREALRSTLVVGMALGMTSYEPVVNLEKLSALYDRFGIDSRANFLYLTLPGIAARSIRERARLPARTVRDGWQSHHGGTAQRTFDARRAVSIGARGRGSAPLAPRHIAR